MSGNLRSGIAVGIRITGYPPHRSRRAQLAHRAPTLGVWRRTSGRATDEGFVAVAAMLRQFALPGPIVSGLFDSAVEAYAAKDR